MPISTFLNLTWYRRFALKLLPLVRHPYSQTLRREARQRLRQYYFIRHAPEAITTIFDVIQSYTAAANIRLDGGTLLGAYRNHGFLQHDYDIDLCVMEEDCSKGLIEYIEAHGFKMTRMFTLKSIDKDLDGFVAEYTFQYAGAVDIDLSVTKRLTRDTVKSFIFDAESGLSYRQTLKKYNGALRVQTKIVSIDGLKDMEFAGRPWKVPSNTDSYLKQLYGNDYMVPVVYSFSDRPKTSEVALDNDTLGILRH